jgi:hypothetical protein
MPSFTVTTDNTKLTLDPSGSAQASFTVTNTTMQPTTGRLLATAEGTAAAQWFTIVGDPTREFPANGAEQVAVQVAVPTGSSPGSYSFRLDAVGEEDPDEDYSQGPSVGFEIPEPPPVTPRKFPWWIVIVALIVLIGIGVAIWLITKSPNKPPTPTTAVPQVIGQKADTAGTTLLDAGFAVRETKRIPSSPDSIGLVISQSPSGGVAPQGSTVDVTVGVSLASEIGVVTIPLVLR